MLFDFLFGNILDDRKIQSVTVGTGPGGFIKSRPTSRGFILYGRGDEIEFAVEVDERDYSQFSISRRNIRYVLTTKKSG